jgi:tRNA(Ile)-lysidine synthase
MSDHALAQALLRAFRQHDLITPGETLVVAVSGGADSLALLRLLRDLRPTLRIDLHVATLDHGLRGEAGANDAAFVAHIAEAWGLPVSVGRAEVASLAAHMKVGVEAAARRARYDFLASVAAAIRAGTVAAAHHADDQAETILMRLLRGAGNTGVSGMAYRSLLPGHPDLTLIRPLLGTARADLEDYCRAHNLQPRHDPTNADLNFTRNRIRAEVIPALQTINPQIVPALARLGEIAAQDDDLLSQQAAVLIDPADPPDRRSIRRTVFRDLHPALARRWILRAAADLNPDPDLGYDHVLAALQIGREGPIGARALLPGRLQLRVDYDQLWIEPLDAPPVERGYLLPVGALIPVTLDGLTKIEGARWSLRVAVSPMPGAVALNVPPGSTVILRTRQRGDRFAPPGLGGHTRSLARWMIDHKIPAPLRDRIPILEIAGMTAAVLKDSGWVISEHFVSLDASPLRRYVFVNSS